MGSVEAGLQRGGDGGSGRGGSGARDHLPPSAAFPACYGVQGLVQRCCYSVGGAPEL